MYFRAYTNTHIFLCVFGDVIQAHVDRAAADSYVRVQVSYKQLATFWKMEVYELESCVRGHQFTDAFGGRIPFKV